MGQPQDDPVRRLPSLSSPKRRGFVLPAIAASTIIVAALGPLSGGALGDGWTAGSPTPTGGESTTVTTSDKGAEEAGSGKQEAGAGKPAATVSPAPAPTTTSTGPAASPPATTTSTGPAASPPATTSPPTAPKRQRARTRQKARNTPAPAASGAPTVFSQHSQKATAGAKGEPAPRHSQPATGGKGTLKRATNPPSPGGPNNVALAPQIVAAEAGALAAEFAGSAASAQALAFYRIPLFLLPIYQAAAVQYGVPWQILAAINEIETNYGTDQSVSTAGAVGWMQFMPATWMQYGVDALNAGYADPYNPVDAIFAAARYLRAAGAATNLHTAILAYNHSEEYASSVLLRAKLISTYPKPVIATLTGLIDDRLPVTGKRLAWGPLPAEPSSSSATANATAVPGAPAPAGAHAPTPAPSAAPAPTAAAAVAAGQGSRSPQPEQLVDLMSAPNAAAVAVQDGRIVELGRSRSLGRYVILRDVYGDVFTYAGLGSIASTYRLPKQPRGGRTVKAPVVGAAGTHDPAPSQPASAGRPGPLTLSVQTPSPPIAPTQVSVPLAAGESAPAGMGKVRLFAHPGNPDALAAAANAAISARKAASRAGASDRPLPLRAGSVVAKGTVLGHVRTPLGAKDGHLRFAIRPAHDLNTIDPRPILSNWVQLDTALHPKGATGETALLGATASDVFLFPKSQLEREVLSDPGIVMSACARQEVASGAIDKRVLAALAFLSRSGLKPSVGTLRCGGGAYAVTGYVAPAHIGDGVAITKINGLPVQGHQGSGSITDLTIRTLLTVQGEFIPQKIVSLMTYPGAPSTLARPDHGDYIEVVFSPAPPRALGLKSARAAAHSAGAGRTAGSPLAVGSDLSPAEWNQLISHIATLPVPVVAVKPSSSAIPDPKTP
jgi:membrane-bound lytic murein transglycosylase B